jgi:hypothetical protein
MAVHTRPGDFGRDAGNHVVGVHILQDDGPGANNSPAADLYSLADHRTLSDESAIADFNITRDIGAPGPMVQYFPI